MSELSPFTGFGNDPNWSVKFGIRQERASLPQWESPAALPVFDMPNPTGGPVRRVGQHMGRLPRQVSWRLWFDSQDDLDRMDAMVGTRATLRYLSRLTSTVGGSVEVIGAVSYLALPGTKLLALSDIERYVDGTCEATATFERPYVAPVVPEPPVYPPPPVPIPLPLPSLLLPLDGDLDGWDGDGPITATGSGGLRWIDSDVPVVQAALVEEGTTNHHRNPHGVAQTWGWTPATDATLSRDTGNLPPGLEVPADAASIKHTKTATSAMSCGQHWDHRVSGSLGGQTWTVSCWVYHDRPGTETITARMEVSGASWPSGSSFAVAPLTWTRISVTATLGAGTTDMAGRVATPSWSAGYALWLYGMQVEQKPAPTSLCPAYESGVLVSGNVWNGTPHDSTSTRTAAQVSSPALNRFDSVSGSMILRMTPRNALGSGAIVAAGTWGDGDLLFVQVGGGDASAFFRAHDSGVDTVQDTASITLDTPATIYVEWDGTATGIAVNDGAISVGTRVAPTGDVEGTIRLNGDSTASFEAGRLAFFDRPLTDVERARVTALIEAGSLDIDDFGP